MKAAVLIDLLLAHLCTGLGLHEYADELYRSAVEAVNQWEAEVPAASASRRT
jgi:hypothetical protein